jgi:hypothetical protein
MRDTFNRRQFLRAGIVAGASLALPRGLFAAEKKSVLVFTKSSGFEHDVVKTSGGKPSILEQAVTALGKKHSSTSPPPRMAGSSTPTISGNTRRYSSSPLEI